MKRVKKIPMNDLRNRVSKWEEIFDGVKVTLKPNWSFSEDHHLTVWIFPDTKQAKLAVLRAVKNG